MEGNSSLSASWYCETNGYNLGPNAPDDIYDLEAGIYMLTVSDVYGCDSIKFIEVEEGSTLIIPSAISPNGDGLNDQWILPDIDYFTDSDLKVFSRWGNLVYEVQGYQNDWDGVNMSGSPLPDGTYFFVLTLGNDTEAKTGFIMIQR